ncbi:MAG: response regulator [Terriglobales bacterium]
MPNILVADDDPSIRHLIRTLLRRDGHSITLAKDGASALAQLQKKTFDLVLMDVHMPHLGGLDVLAKVREQGKRPKVIIMTADNTPETLLQAVREQAYQYVPKPFHAKQLSETVTDALASGGAGMPIEVVSASPEWVELLVPCEHGVADRVQGFMSVLKAGLPDDLRQAVGSAFREMLLNAIEWGGQFDPTRKVRVSYLRAKRMLLYRIADPGAGFSLDGLTHAAVSNAPDDPIGHMQVREEKGLRPGGFGILLAKAKVDEVIYNEARNEVVLVKYLD